MIICTSIKLVLFRVYKQLYMLRGESCSHSTNTSWPWRHHVFLSFKGEDISLSFENCLYASLQQKEIITFGEDQQLEKGDVISQEFLQAIEESLASIVVLSENYASSTWCLDELQQIIETKREQGSAVLPIFYGVSPSDVRYQINSFGHAFQKHATRFEQHKERVQQWRNSLNEVAGFSGWEYKNWEEAKLIEDIVESVWRRLYPKLSYYNFDGLVGIDSRVEKMISLLRIEVEEVRFIGMWGMNGIGKTTLAKVVYDKIRDQFEISCFIDMVSKISSETDGMLSLQRKILSHQKVKGLEIESLDGGKNTIRNLLFNKKVLLVLDDVDDIRQLESLAEKKEWFGAGSRVIITTRDIHLLSSHDIAESYEIDLLNQDESLQLLCQKGFKRDQPQEHLSEVVKHGRGLPLAINALDMIKDDRENNNIVMKTLKVSYDGLTAPYKTLFLDIACFFEGWVKEHVIQILKHCDRYPPIGIEVLIEKCLITYDGLRLGMHGLLLKMGRGIVIEECPEDAGKCSRLWSIEHIDEVLKSNKATEFIQGIVLKSSTEPYEAMWNPEAFSKMCNLKFLIIDFHNMQLTRGLALKCLSSSLKVLHWTRYPSEALPLGEQLDELVDLRMHHSKIVKIWDENQFFKHLKYIDLSHSKDLIETPIVSGAPCLQSMLLDGCLKLVKVHQSVGQHKKLVLLSMKNCINLQTFPRKLEMDSLEKLILSGCSKVKKLPEFGTNMECLSELSLENCKNLVCLSKSISNLKSLRRLNISGCSRFCMLPNNMNENECVEELDVNGTAIREISSSQIRLENLKEFSFDGKIVQASNSWNLLQRMSKLL